jgi:hypothetical protein
MGVARITSKPDETFVAIVIKTPFCMFPLGTINHDPNQMVYFTYADAFSYRMYRSLGFKPVPGFETPIEKDGTKWTPMGFSTTGILSIPNTMASSRSYWEPHIL